MFLTYVEAAYAQKKTGANLADPLILPIADARKQHVIYFESINQDLPPVPRSHDEELLGLGNKPDLIVRKIYQDTHKCLQDTNLKNILSHTGSCYVVDGSHQNNLLNK